ncbi:amidase [Streptomyces sp. NPDC055078]
MTARPTGSATARPAEGGTARPTLSETADAIAAGRLSSTAAVRSCVAAADAHDARLGMFHSRFTDTALEAAAAADRVTARGGTTGPLHGLPLGIKDLLTTREGPTTAGSMVPDPVSGSGDAVAVARLRDAGAVILGKLHTAEYAIGTPDPGKPLPVPRNPWDPRHWAGGSSSGSASAVASGAVLGALGTDTGGSIRIPAAFCGITGLKPTFGRVPKSGCVPLAYSLDHVGPMAPSARDCAVLLGALAGHHPGDPASLDVPVADWTAALTGDLSGVRIGVDRLSRIGGPAEDPALPTVFTRAVEALRDLGAQVVELELPLYEELTAACHVTLVSEAFAYHRERLAAHWDDYFRTTRLRIASAVHFSGADYVQAQRVRGLARRALAGLLSPDDGVDLIVTPTCGSGAPTIDELTRTASPGARGLFRAVYTHYWNGAGNPVASVPMGFSGSGLPLGLQIAGRPFDEALVLRAGDAFQQITDWHRRTPEPAAARTGPVDGSGPGDGSGPRPSVSDSESDSESDTESESDSVSGSVSDSVPG